MKTSLIVIGLLVVLVGVRAVVAPKSWTRPSGGSRFNHTATFITFSKESSVYFGWGTIGLGVAAMVVGFRYERMVRPPTDHESAIDE